MSPALANARRGNEREARRVVQCCDAVGAAVAHGRTDLAERNGEVVFESSRVRDVGVDAFLNKRAPKFQGK